MNPEVKQDLLEALCSGRYRQNRYALRQPGGEFCLFGVLCDLKDSSAWVDEGYGLIYWRCPEHSCTLPPEVAEWAGIKTTQTVSIDGIDLPLSTLNDVGVPFEKLAKLIEEQL